MKSPEMTPTSCTPRIIRRRRRRRVTKIDQKKEKKPRIC